MPPVPKPSTVREVDYRHWISRHRCVVSNGDCRYARYEKATEGDFVSDCCHYLAKRVFGDLLLFPACRFHHQEQHAIGVESFAEKYGLKLLELCQRFRERYLNPDWMSAWEAA
jgi:hypothetical protein